MSTLEILGLLYVIVIGICFVEAYFCTKFDPESEKFMKEREEKNKNK